MSKTFRRVFSVQERDIADQTPVEDFEDIELIKDIIADDIEEGFLMQLGVLAKELSGSLVFEPCIIANQKDAPRAGRITAGNAHGIILNARDGGDWAKIIFGLSSEMVRYLCGFASGDKESLPWVEETVCRAAGLFYLKWFYHQWESFSRVRERFPAGKEYDELLEDLYGEIDGQYYYFDLDYAPVLREYLERLLSETAGGNVLEADKEELERINGSCYEEPGLIAKAAEGLCERMAEEDMAALIMYRYYVSGDGLTLDTEEYRGAFPENPSVEYLCGLCDKINGK